MWSYYNWIRNKVAANTPWDRLVAADRHRQGQHAGERRRQLLRAARRPDQPCPRRFPRRSWACRSTAPSATTIPMEKWTNTSITAWPTSSRACARRTAPSDGEPVVFVATAGDIVQPLTGQPQPPRPLDGQALPMRLARRPARIARPIGLSRPKTRTSPARSSIGSGPTSWASAWSKRSMTCARPTRPATRSLLAAAADYLAEQHFDLKALMRAILQSETYQRPASRCRKTPPTRASTPAIIPGGLRPRCSWTRYSQVTGGPDRVRDRLAQSKSRARR